MTDAEMLAEVDRRLAHPKWIGERAFRWRLRLRRFLGLFAWWGSDAD